MFFSNNPFKVLVFLLSVPFGIYGQNIPKPMAKPEVPVKIYQEVFKEIKKQNWRMAIILADEYENKSFSSYVRWLDITRPGSKHSFNKLKNFFYKHKNWPKVNEIKKKIESSINPSSDPIEVVNWYKENSPITVKGAIDYMEFREKIGILENKKKVIQDIWINKNLTHRQQKYFIKKYSNYWDSNDNWKRFDRLLWDGKNWSARKTLQRIKGDYRALGNARLALSNRAGNVTELIKKVPTHLTNDAGLIYERMRWRRKAKLPTAIDFLIDPPENIKNYRRWWVNARIVIRREINKRNFSLAYKVLNNHKIPLNTKSGIEAEWLAGWIALNFIKNKQSALEHFKNVFNNAKTNYTKSNAAFWLGEIYKTSSNKKDSQKWFKTSASLKMSFYGSQSIKNIESFSFTNKKIQIVKPTNADQLLEVIKILQKANQEKRAYPYLKKVFESCNTIEEKNFVMEYASKFSDKNFVVKLAKLEPKISTFFSHPTIVDYIPDKFRNNKKYISLIHSIILQESAFKISARSHAGARGLMQLMPFTAKKVAKSLKIKYYKKALTTNPHYNILLGTTYIRNLLERFDNSLPLALAGYNAGPARVKIWLKRYGDPRKGKISYINWIESIPIYETRNYVKRVIGNYSIYSRKFNADNLTENFNLAQILKTY